MWTYSNWLDALCQGVSFFSFNLPRSPPLYWRLSLRCRRLLWNCKSDCVKLYYSTFWRSASFFLSYNLYKLLPRRRRWCKQYYFLITRAVVPWIYILILRRFFSFFFANSSNCLINKIRQRRDISQSAKEVLLYSQKKKLKLKATFTNESLSCQ